MNHIEIIGNLVKDPELRTTTSGTNVCTFTVAVNRRRQKEEGADFFTVNAWKELGENCAKYLAKGRKVAVSGSVSLRTYQGRDGKTYSNMDVHAIEVEFLSPRDAEPREQAQQKTDAMSGLAVVETDDLPF